MNQREIEEKGGAKNFGFTLRVVTSTYMIHIERFNLKLT